MKWIEIISDKDYPKINKGYICKNTPAGCELPSEVTVSNIVQIRYMIKLGHSVKWLDEAEPTAPAQGVKQLAKIRNKLYDNLPVGEVDAFRLVGVVKEHLTKLDTFLAGHAAAQVVDQEEWIRLLNDRKLDVDKMIDNYIRHKAEGFNNGLNEAIKIISTK